MLRGVRGIGVSFINYLDEVPFFRETFTDYSPLLVKDQVLAVARWLPARSRPTR